jgi:hypothetical protein
MEAMKVAERLDWDASDFLFDEKRMELAYHNFALVGTETITCD